jgi:hypothetical protein
MVKTVEVEQAEIVVGGNKYTVTHIPTATSGMWFTVHDTFEVWAAVAIDDFSGEVAGWRNPPDKYQAEFEKAIKEAFGIPIS